ncbi:MAG: DUF3152 domain-containing protein, partial [Kribbellaceae bacterium]|nr:DUF3152 domain-containing protein [Kribbellaceae bacterium]
MTFRRRGQQMGARGRHSRRTGYRGQWVVVTLLAVVATVVVAHPDVAHRNSLAAQVVAGVNDVADEEQVVSVTPTPVATPTQKFTTPLRPAPSLTKKPKAFVSSGKLAVVPGFNKANGVRDKLTYRVEIEQGVTVNGAAVAAAIHKTLTDPRGWQALHPVSFERTDKPDADLRIILATPTLTDKLCLP